MVQGLDLLCDYISLKPRRWPIENLAGCQSSPLVRSPLVKLGPGGATVSASLLRPDHHLLNQLRI